MKTINRIILASFGSLLTITAGCGSDDGETPLAGPKQNQDIVHVPLFIRGATGQAPKDPTEPLYEARKNNPIMAPDGHQVTLAEFNKPTGSATVSCTKSGTRAVLDLHGLVPNSVYTAWNVVFKAPGFDPMFTNMIGLGAIGAGDGSHNMFRSSPVGDGHVEATTPGGSLSMMGAIAGCALTDEFEWHVVAAYHIDGQDHGAQLGPDGSAVEQVGFMFKR